MGFTAVDMVSRGRRARRRRWGVAAGASAAAATVVALTLAALPFGGTATSTTAGSSPSDDLVASPGPGGELVKRYRKLPPPTGPGKCVDNGTMDRLGAAVVEQVKKTEGPRGPVQEAAVVDSICERDPGNRPEFVVVVRFKAGGETDTLRVGVTYRRGAYQRSNLCTGVGTAVDPEDRVTCHEPYPTDDRIRLIEWGATSTPWGTRIVRPDDRVVTVLAENSNAPAGTDDGNRLGPPPSLLIDPGALLEVALAQDLAAYAG